MTDENYFGDFDKDDALEDNIVLSDFDWEKVVELQKKYDLVLVIEDPEERKNSAKELVRQMNGEDDGSILAT